ncbi:MAG TPA: methionyl-tRNA formyltransferase [Anaerolineae bacterium]|nr:methionyl-tRNA formyltransferase [Anaerolineae bacterium]
MRERLIFMGTPPFAVPSLEALARDYEVVAVVTQPDRPARRGRQLTPSAVKEAAVRWGLPVLQPESLRHEKAVAQLRDLEPRVMVVAAYGEILRPQVLAIPPAGVINVHPSLLPKYRGASPIEGALLAGEQETGVTIMLMDEGMDTGPILAQRSVAVELEDSAGSLGEKLARLGAELLLDTLALWLDGRIEARPQDDAQATYTRPISKEDAVIDWALPAIEIWNRIRAYNPRPGARTWWEGDQLNVLRGRPRAEWKGQGGPGRVVQTTSGVAVVTGQGALLLEEIQLAGKRTMDAEDFVRGQRQFIGSELGQQPKE